MNSQVITGKVSAVVRVVDLRPGPPINGPARAGRVVARPWHGGVSRGSAWRDRAGAAPGPRRGRAGGQARAREAVAEVAVALKILEILEVTRPAGRVHELIAGNVFHRAVAFGRLHRTGAVAASRRAWLAVDDEVRASTPTSREPVASLLALARLLAAIGERLAAGDRVITGTDGPCAHRVRGQGKGRHRGSEYGRDLDRLNPELGRAGTRTSRPVGQASPESGSR